MSADTERLLKEALAREAALVQRLEDLQAANEALYAQSWDVNGGPHFCRKAPFGRDPGPKHTNNCISTHLKGSSL